MKKPYEVEYSTADVNTGSDVLAGVGLVVMALFVVSSVLQFVI